MREPTVAVRDEPTVEADAAPGGGAGPRGSARGPLEWTWVVVLFVAVGALERVWVATHPLGTLTSDGSVIGLMALHLLHHGQLPAYMWGQAYGSNLEAVETAVAFKLSGVGTTQLLATAAFTSAIAAVAVWRAGRWIVGEPAARLAALALWVWPPLYTWRSLKPGGTYLVALILAWCAVGAIARLKRGDVRWQLLAAIGLLTGLALWSSPMSLQLLIPAAVWCRAPLRRLGRRCWVIVAGGFVGGFPVVWFAATHHASNLWYPGQRSFVGAYAGRFLQFFWWEWPIALGGGAGEGFFAWVLGPLGALLVVAGTVAVVLVARAVLQGRAERCRLPVLTLALLPFVFASNSLANHVGQGRYVLFGATMGTLLVGVGLENLGREAARRRDARHAASDDAASAPPHWPACRGCGPSRPGRALRCSGSPHARARAGVPARRVPRRRRQRPAERRRPAHAGFASTTSASRSPRTWLAYRLSVRDRRAHGGPRRSRSSATRPIYDKVSPRSPRPAYLFLSASPTLGRFEAWSGRAPRARPGSGATARSRSCSPRVARPSDHGPPRRAGRAGLLVFWREAFFFFFFFFFCEDGLGELCRRRRRGPAVAATGRSRRRGPSAQSR